ncbi:MAG: NADH-quinone oxidoreductase subunit [Actinomycetota bacterium]|nr:NADH-quinone oxidoreductase subunit [Actinomycetota bacterium]
MTTTAALLTVIIPAVVSVLGLFTGSRWRPWAREWAVLGSLTCLGAAVLEVYGVLADGPVRQITLLGEVDTGIAVLSLDLRADELSAFVAVAVALVACCVQIYSTAYLGGEGTPDEPLRYPAFAATVSLFTSAMMLVIHAEDLVLLLMGWEIMGISSYLLIGHHSERDSARAAAVKAFLVTRFGDLGVTIAVVMLIVTARTTAIRDLLARAEELPQSTVTAVALLLLMGVAGKSAQFPLHTWLPDAMEGPTPVSALIHAATMVAAGVFLVARLLPLFLAADAALTVAAVIASITMLGAALAALAQDDLKRVLAWSTISQVAYMLAGVSMAQAATDAGPGVFHLLSHAAFKAMLFLIAGCVTHLVGSTLMVHMGGLQRTNLKLSVLFGIGLAALAGVPPLSGFWSKETVLTAAEHSAMHGGGWAAWLVLVSGMLTALVTGIYAARAYGLVCLGDRRPPPADGGHGVHDHLPSAMTGVLYVLAVPTVLLGLLMVHPPELLESAEIALPTAALGTLLPLAGIAWVLHLQVRCHRDVADLLPGAFRAFLRSGYRLDDVQDALVVRPVKALARVVAAGDRDVVDAGPRGTASLAQAGGIALRRAQTGLATGYVTWLVAGALAVGIAGVVLA